MVLSNFVDCSTFKVDLLSVICQQVDVAVNRNWPINSWSLFRQTKDQSLLSMHGFLLTCKLQSCKNSLTALFVAKGVDFHIQGVFTLLSFQGVFLVIIIIQ